MNPQETFVEFKERFSHQVGTLTLRAHAGIIHLYTARWPFQGLMMVTPGRPVCCSEARYLAAIATPTADAPTCKACLAAMRLALEGE